MHSKLKLQVFLVWFMLVFSVGIATFILPQAIRFFTQASDCYTTEINTSFGFAPTGRPCPNPELVTQLPYELPSAQSPTPINSVLYMATFPLYIFALFAIIGTVGLGLILKLHPTSKSPRP